MARLFASTVIAGILVPALALAYGEPDADGLPNARERLLHVFTNQVRAAPHEWPDWDTSLASAAPRDPLVLDARLFSAARFHAADMAVQGCFSHESCDGTPFEARLSRFYGPPAGENIYKGTGAHNARARTAITGWMNSPGHRTNILREAWTSLGTGFAGTGQIYYVQNFGQESGVDVPTIVGGAYEDLGDDDIAVLANHFDASGRAPAAFEAVLGDRRIPMAPVAGRAGHQTFSGTGAMPAGCEPLFFVSTDEAGARTTFPTAGALLAGAACTEHYTSERRGTVPGEKGPDVFDANDEAGGCRCAAPGRRPLDAGWLVTLLLPLGLGLRRKVR